MTLVLVLLAYAVIGTVVTMFFGKRLINLNFQQLRREADFRYDLVHIRDNVESIAFYRGEGREKNQVKERLREAIGNLRMLIGWERNLEFFTKGYECLILVLPIVVMAPLYFSAQIKFGVMTQAEGAFVSVLGALSIIVSQFEQLSNFAAGITRLETFATALDQPAAKATARLPSLSPVKIPGWPWSMSPFRHPITSRRSSGMRRRRFLRERDCSSPGPAAPERVRFCGPSPGSGTPGKGIFPARR